MPHRSMGSSSRNNDGKRLFLAIYNSQWAMLLPLLLLVATVSPVWGRFYFVSPRVASFPYLPFMGAIVHATLCFSLQRKYFDRNIHQLSSQISSDIHPHPHSVLAFPYGRLCTQKLELFKQSSCNIATISNTFPQKEKQHLTAHSLSQIGTQLCIRKSDDF